jgi:hypothetical protein
LPRGWWAARIRRTVIYLRPIVGSGERGKLEGWLTEAELRLFDAMPAADRRHGLDVVRALRTAGAASDRELLVAGLLHDCGKGPRVRLAHRVAWSLGRRYGSWILRAAERLPTFRFGLARLRDHATISANLARDAGCSDRTMLLIRNQETPIDDAGRLLLAADEDN